MQPTIPTSQCGRQSSWLTSSPHALALRTANGHPGLRRECEGKHRALAPDALDRDLPAVGRHNLLRNVEPQARPARFGGIQGRKNLLQTLGRHAAARIAHLEL